MSDVKFFSEQWCELALAAEKDNTAQIYNGFKDPATFTHVMSVECTDRPGLITQIEYVQGRAASWSTKLWPEDQVWVRFTADVDTWRMAAEGDEQGSTLIMAGKIKIAKGLMKDLVENADAFNNWVLSWGDVSTDWNV